MNGITAIIASAVGVAWIVWYLGWRLRSRTGLRRTDRARRASNALMGWAAFEGFVLTGTLVWSPALGVVFVLLPLWLVLRGVITIVDRSAERAAQRRDMLNGYPPEPRPVSWDNIFMVIVLWWFAIAYVGAFLTLVFLLAFAGPEALESDLSTNVLVGSVGACVIPAVVIAVARKLRRDRAIRDFQALTAGIESRLRLAQGTQPDGPRDEQ
jgi:hypothetical protein